MSETIRDFLKFKDDPKVTGAKLPVVATMNREEAVRHLFNQQQEKAYEISAAAKCI